MTIRKRIVCLLAVLAALGSAVSCDSMLGDWLDTPSGERDVIWKNVGYNYGTATLSYGQTGPVDPRLFSDGSSLYAGWVNSGSIHIMKYNGDDSSPNWEYYNDWFYGSTSECAFAFFQGKIHLLYADATDIFSNFYDPYNFIWDTDQSISYSPGNVNSPANPRLVEHHGILYAQWKEGDRVRVKRFDGGG